MLLLRALVAELAARPELLGPLPPVEDAWQLLLEAERHFPEATDDLLTRPQAGAWLHRMLRALRAGPASALPSWSDLGYLHAAAAAAAIRAGIGFRITVPAQDDGVMLPGLGFASLPGTGPGQIAQVVADEDGPRLTCRGLTVRPGPVRPGAPGAWWPLRAVRSHLSDVRCSVLLDDLDPWRNFLHKSGAARLGPREADDWQRVFADAWHLICAQDRVAADGVAACLLSIAPLPDRSPAEVFSGSAPDAFGGVLMSRPGDPAEMAATLIHEAQHIKLSGLLDMATLLEGGTEEDGYAPWRSDPRPLRGILQGTYAFLGVTALWLSLRDSSATDADGAKAEYEFALRRAQTCQGLRTLRSAARLTGEGEEFLNGMQRTLEALLGVTAEPWAVRAAGETLDDHRTIFRLCHLRRAAPGVEEWAAALLDGSPPPREPPGTELAAGPHSLSARTQLTRLRITAPGAFRRRGARLAATYSPIPAADYDWAAGDRRSALEKYRRRLLDGDDVPAVWAGFGLSLPAGPARRAMLTRPELVAAVHEAARWSAGAAPTPDEVAHWIGTAAEQDTVTPVHGLADRLA
jgi:HEXXH motif-containing protein